MTGFSQNWCIFPGWEADRCNSLRQPYRNIAAFHIPLIMHGADVGRLRIQNTMHGAYTVIGVIQSLGGWSCDDVTLSCWKGEEHCIGLEEYDVWLKKYSYAVLLFCILPVHFIFLWAITHSSGLQTQQSDSFRLFKWPEWTSLREAIRKNVFPLDIAACQARLSLSFFYTIRTD